MGLPATTSLNSDSYSIARCGSAWESIGQEYRRASPLSTAPPPPPIAIWWLPHGSKTAGAGVGQLF